jgi:non-ribosomal peptide synthetase component F
VDEWKSAVEDDTGKAIIGFCRRNIRSLDEGAARKDTAYMFDTSGSTSNPKGVVILQKNVPNLAQWLSLAQVQCTSHDCVLFQSSISFDILDLYLLLGLIFRIRVAIVPEISGSSGDMLVECCIANAVSVFFMVQSQILLLCENAIFMEFGCFKWSMIGGETFSLELARKLKVLAGVTWAVYGPTESVMYVSCFPINEQACFGQKSVPIGKCFPNLALLVSNKTLKIFGPQVGEKYINLPEKTKTAFVYNI